MRNTIGCVTQWMLTKHLRELEASGPVNRTVCAAVPPRVEYELTGEGESLQPALAALKQWGETYALQLLKKTAFDHQTEAKTDR